MKPMEMAKRSRSLARNAKFISDLSMPPIHYQWKNLRTVCGKIYFCVQLFLANFFFFFFFFFFLLFQQA